MQEVISKTDKQVIMFDSLFVNQDYGFALFCHILIMILIIYPFAKDLVLRNLWSVDLKNGLGNELNMLLRFIYQSIIHKRVYGTSSKGGKTRKICKKINEE